MKKIREIQEADLPTVVHLLCEGFQRRNRLYWEQALSFLSGKPRVRNLPVFGLALDVDGVLQGVMLMISSQKGDDIFCNLSSWYMRPEFRAFSPLLFQRALRFKGVCYTDCSPAPHIMPIIQKFGFRPYTAGTLLIDPRACWRRGEKIRDVRRLTEGDCGAAEQEVVNRHLSYGCEGFLLESASASPMPVLYRTTKLKGKLPAARILYGQPARVLSSSGPLMRNLIKRGILLMLVDLPCDFVPDLGLVFPDYDLRYVKGSTPPEVGDLLDTEVSIFGV